MQKEIIETSISVGLIAGGAYGLYVGTPYAGWILAVGLLMIVFKYVF